MRREVVKHLSDRFPIFEEEGPSFCLVQPDEISMRAFTELSGGADSFIILPEAAASSEDLLDMEDGLMLDEDSIHDYTSRSKTIIKELFPVVVFLEEK